ncbi:F-box and leucine-rich repeat protein GRR1 [Exophiala viscosa]|uniref:Peptide hydrolase n=1 Tax=Exophiala viscosa TaxID=2486360 RepID=A0AAN6E314_9EURO|nr:F-box and leucine-rich repeat protein GRR1 [Exophiala viscosa]
MAWLSNPIAFTRGPVTFITTIIYLAIIVALIVVQTGVPSPPDTPTPIHGINLTEAWLDLQLLSGSHHPYNSHRNDAVHDWLLSRVESILKENHALSSTNSSSAYIFEDNLSNLTFSSERIPRAAGISVYFEGTNIIVYIPGTEDDKKQWWLAPNGKPSARNAVLVNAHYDSVSTGFGATDDGVGVVCVLQLARYFTTSGNQPKNGVVLLLNNGEEDFLNGANVFGQHPMSKLVSTFLNLEGAGAGGRAALFRSTDDAVTKAYAHSKYPFGSSTTADGFNRGLIRSQTDYVVFNGKLGYRGLDVAFIGPRARYHTDQDDSRHTGKGSLWHMLSTAVATTRALTAASLTTNLDPGHTPGSAALWFDVFGRAFAVLQAHTFFALAVALLVAGPIILFLTLVLLYRFDKFYFFSGSRAYHMADGDDNILLYGWRGFFRFPLILLVACATPIALALLLSKENQYIAHSSEWAVWSMMISSFVFVAWFLCRTADFARPSSLTRAYGLSWMWAGWWALLVAATVFEEHFHLIGTYFVLIYTASVFFATWFAYLELFSLPKKSTYCRGKVGEEHFSSRSRSTSRLRQDTPVSAPEDGGDEPEEDDDENEPTERSSLLRSRGRSTFKGYRPEEAEATPSIKTKEETSDHHHEEQEWSKSQWTWLWLLQMLLLIPINLIVVGQIGFLTTEGLHQTGQDGSSTFLVYIMIAASTILLCSPLVPILHRFTWQVPVFLLFVLIGTLIYNLTAFPFSPGNRVKLFFLQQVDLDAGNNSVSLQGVPGFVRQAIASIPSAAGQELQCNATGPGYNLERCSWSGLPPNVAKPNSATPLEKQYKSWLNFNVTRLNDSEENKARFVLYGRNTRACKLVFDSPISAFQVNGQAPRDKRFLPVPEAGSNEVRLWSRTWDRAWTVDVSWLNPEEDGPPKKSNETLTGKVICLWSDVNQVGLIPAFDEAKHFLPNWVAITKAEDGLVEGYKRFSF